MMQRSCTLIFLSLLAPALGGQLWATKQFLSEAASGHDAKLENEDNMIIKMPEWIPSVVSKASLAEGKAKSSVAVDASAELAHLSREARAEILMDRMGSDTDDAMLARKPLEAPNGAQALRPVVQAKVKKVMHFIESNNDAYEKSDAEGKKKLEQDLQDQVAQNQGAVGFDWALCLQLWNTPKIWASKMVFWNCPSLIFPEKDIAGPPPYNEVITWKPSKLKSAWLSQYMVLSAVGQKTSNHDICKQIAPRATLWTGKTYSGKDKVCIKLEGQGWPISTEVKGPEYWKCDKDSCTVPVKAWAEQTCTIYMHFTPEGKVNEMHLPLPCWR